MASHNIGYCLHQFVMSHLWSLVTVYNRFVLVLPRTCSGSGVETQGGGGFDKLHPDDDDSQYQTTRTGGVTVATIQRVCVWCRPQSTSSSSINSISAPGMELLLSVSISITVTLRECSSFTTVVDGTPVELSNNFPLLISTCTRCEECALPHTYLST